jgi:hypothetical protein
MLKDQDASLAWARSRMGRVCTAMAATCPKVGKISAKTQEGIATTLSVLPLIMSETADFSTGMRWLSTEDLRSGAQR